MTSRKAEERNEKIIRGLMKLPPNRRCFNCDSLGPQYVCTNFRTFICTTCSGIHREFSHRVKSVSMSKFTSQEVEALQEGGNQRAREVFLKDWDPRRQRLPDSSNTDKVREFIKSVYVDRSYCGAKTSDKPPRDNLRDHVETRRASSYHSFSQSPPYDYQYEERHYGKQARSLTRKPGSDRANYDGSLFSFFSPSRFSDHVNEDVFSNEEFSARPSDYSASSGGDLFRTFVQSPKFQGESGVCSPTFEAAKDIVSEDLHSCEGNAVLGVNDKRFPDTLQHTQNTAPSGSIRPLNSSKSVDSVGKEFVASAPEKSVAYHTTVSTFSSLAHPSVPTESGGLALFSAPFTSQSVASTAPAIDLFWLPDPSSASSVDFFQPSPISVATPSCLHEHYQTLPSTSLDLFSNIPHPQPAASLNEKAEAVIEKNEGWATFDMPKQMEPSQSIKSSAPEVVPCNQESLGNFLQLLSLDSSSHWTPCQDTVADRRFSAVHNQLNDGWHVQNCLNGKFIESWGAFEDTFGNLLFHNIDKESKGDLVVQDVSVSDQYLLLRAPKAVSHPYVINRKSGNPFDLPGDSDFESSHMLDMGSLQAALQNQQLPTSSIIGSTESWFPQDTGVPPTGSQESIGFMGGQIPVPKVPSQGPIASIGGNPFE